MRQVFKNLLSEQEQILTDKRKELIDQIETRHKKTVITFMTSFKYYASIEDQDAVVLEEICQNTKIENGIILFLNSLGGSGLAAERIINVLNTYSQNSYEVIVPNMAKSAATMICLGGKKLYMSKTSELGPIDPQIQIKIGETPRMASVHGIITSYDNLLEKAVTATGRLEPYLQQLSRYDARDIEEYKKAMELSESIAVRSLKKGMMVSFSESDIKQKIEPFLSPLQTKSHGRPIFIDEARNCGLSIDEISVHDESWKDIWELYLRSNYLLQGNIIKIVESKTDNFYVGKN